MRSALHVQKVSFRGISYELLASGVHKSKLSLNFKIT